MTLTVQANMIYSENGQPQSQQTVSKQRSLSNLKPFTKGDRRINRKGRPKNFDQFRELARAIAHEKITDKDGELMTRVEAILRSWTTSKQPVLQLAFIAYCYGKPPEKLEVNKLEPRTRLILHYGNELPAREASASALRLRLSAPGDGNSESALSI
jgi:hypothetical protein